MKRTIGIVLSILAIGMFILAGCSKEGPIATSTQSTESKSDSYVVIMKQSGSDGIQSTESTRNQVLSVINTHGIAMSNVSHVYDAAVKGFAGRLTAQQAETLKNDKSVEIVEKDQLFSINDEAASTKVMSMPKDKVVADFYPWGVSYVGGFTVYTGSNQAWIVDTGIDLTHPDLNVNTSQSRTFVSYGTDATTPNDMNGHGTHVSGIIAAKYNGIGVIGIAAGANVVAVKVLSYSGSGYTSDIVAGLNYVLANARYGDVVNMSLGGGISTSLDYAVSKFAGTGINITLAAGNSSTYAGNTSPARVNGTGIYTISAHDQNGAFAYFSNYGNPPIDYSAPGVNIPSCYKNGQYAYMSGTSMAAPHAAGILLANGGYIRANGYVTGDPDGNPDPKAHR